MYGTTHVAVSDTKVSFEVENPNLQDDVRVSFVANAPMTDEEAKEALEKARQACLTASEGARSHR